MRDVLLLIPTYNEEHNIGAVLEGLRLAELDADILVLNDGSSDRTEQVAHKGCSMVISHPANLGYGAALQTGFKFAVSKGYRYVVQCDADGQHSPRDVAIIVREIRKGEADVVIGSRFLLYRDSPLGGTKVLAIHFFARLIRRLTGYSITDPTSGLRGLSRRVFSYYAEQDRFPADFPDADLLIHMAFSGYEIHEIGVGSYPRRRGKSMHSGIKPLFYVAKISLSILVVWLNHIVDGRRDQHA